MKALACSRLLILLIMPPAQQAPPEPEMRGVCWHHPHVMEKGGRWMGRGRQSHLARRAWQQLGSRSPGLEEVRKVKGKDSLPGHVPLPPFPKDESNFLGHQLEKRH